MLRHLISSIIEGASMDLLVNGPTGLQALRYLRYRHKLKDSNAKPQTLDLQPPSQEELSRISSLIGTLEEPMHLSVGSAKDRRRIDGARCSVCSRTFPARSLIELDDRLWIPSPELLFLQMHDHLTELECLALGFELCGSYCRRGTVAFEYNLPAVTTPDKLRRFLDRSARVRHCKRARRTLRFVRANAASPREAQLAILLSLPFRYGGYAFSNPVLNRPINVSSVTGAYWGYDERRTDISWTGKSIAVEYDSSEFHAGSEKIENDAKRRTLLQAAGFHVVVVTNDQFKRISEMDRVERTLGRLMGCRRRNRNKDYELKKRQLHQALLELSI